MARFLAFLRGPARQAERLYILGDLFEYWAGDDNLDAPFNQSICQALHALTDSSVPVFFIAGNRDFLISVDFAQRTGVTLLDEPALIDLYGRPTLLLHGDLLCTDDSAYQTFRAMVRQPAWQQRFLAQALPQRLASIAELRQRSREEKQGKAMSIMDTNATAVERCFLDHATLGAQHMIHGHTHRQAIHTLEIGGKPCERWVLGDWHELAEEHTAQGNYLACTAQGWQFHTW